MNDRRESAAATQRRLRSVERYTDALDLSMGDLIERVRTLEQKVYDIESRPRRAIRERNTKR